MIVGSSHSQGTYLGCRCRFDPLSGHIREAVDSHIVVSLFLSLPPSLSSSHSKISRHILRQGFFFKRSLFQQVINRNITDEIVYVLLYYVPGSAYGSAPPAPPVWPRPHFRCSAATRSQWGHAGQPSSGLTRDFIKQAVLSPSVISRSTGLTEVCPCSVSPRASF